MVGGGTISQRAHKLCFWSVFHGFVITGMPIVRRWFHGRVLLRRRVHPEHMWRRTGVQLGGSAVRQ